MFIKELKQNATSFYDNVGMFQTWAETDFSRLDVKDLIERIVRSDRKALKMWELYNKEAATRGRNKWALYSAFTNYASYADEKMVLSCARQATTLLAKPCGSVSRKLHSGLILLRSRWRRKCQPLTKWLYKSL